MWRWLIGLCLALPLILGTPAPVFAATSAEVTVTAVGYVENPGAPGGFTLTYISDFEVGISWTKGEDAENTLIRAKYGSYPEGRYDGYLVYYGNGTSCSDTGVSLDETATPVYYRAWSEDSEGEWSPLFAEDFVEGIGMTLIAIILLGALMTVPPLISKTLWPMFIVAILVWVGSGIVLWSYDVGSLQWVMGWACVSVALFCAFQAIRHMLSARPPKYTDEDEQRDYAKQVRKVTKRSRRY